MILRYNFLNSFTRCYHENQLFVLTASGCEFYFELKESTKKLSLYIIPANRVWYRIYAGIELGITLKISSYSGKTFISSYFRTILKDADLEAIHNQQEAK